MRKNIEKISKSLGKAALYLLSFCMKSTMKISLKVVLFILQHIGMIAFFAGMIPAIMHFSTTMPEPFNHPITIFVVYLAAGLPPARALDRRMKEKTSELENQ